MQRFFSQHFYIDSKSPCFVNFGTIKEFEIVFLIVMNDFRFIDRINDDKPARVMSRNLVRGGNS